MKHPAEILRDNGLRPTPQRVAIYDVLSKTTTHPTAEAVYREVKRQFPSMSLNTVYKTLLSFEETGLIQRLSTRDVFSHYDANTSPHVHAVCLRCGRVRDVPGDFSSELGGLLKQVTCNTDFSVKSDTYMVFGYCPDCKNR